MSPAPALLQCMAGRLGRHNTAHAQPVLLLTVGRQHQAELIQVQSALALCNAVQVPPTPGPQSNTLCCCAILATQWSRSDNAAATTSAAGLCSSAPLLPCPSPPKSNADQPHILALQHFPHLCGCPDSCYRGSWRTHAHAAEEEASSSRAASYTSLM